MELPSEPNSSSSKKADSLVSSILSRVEEELAMYCNGMVGVSTGCFEKTNLVEDSNGFVIQANGNMSSVKDGREEKYF